MSFNCPECQTLLKIPSILDGKPVRCPSCRRVFSAPRRRPSETFPVKCPSCQGSLKAQLDHAGKPVRCPKCRHAFTLPTHPPPQAQQAPPDPALVAINCPACERRLGARLEHAGKRTRCPRCGTAFTIPRPPAAPPVSPPPPAPKEEPPLPGPGAVFEIACPSCQAALQAGTEDVGRVEPCPACGIPFEIPAPRGCSQPIACSGIKLPKVPARQIEAENTSTTGETR